METIKIYTWEYCMKCKQFKKFLDGKWIEYTSLNAEDYMEVVKESWINSLPIVDVNWEYMDFDKAVQHFINN